MQSVSAFFFSSSLVVENQIFLQGQIRHDRGILPVVTTFFDSVDPIP